MKSAAVTAFRFHFNFVAISFSFNCLGVERCVCVCRGRNTAMNMAHTVPVNKRKWVCERSGEGRDAHSIQRALC